MSKIPLQTKSTKLWSKVKSVHKVSNIKAHETNLKLSHFWNDIIKDMERKAIIEAKQTKIKVYDLSTTLPKKLYKRVSKIIPMEPFENEHFEDNTKDKLEDDFDENTYSLLKILGKHFPNSLNDNDDDIKPIRPIKIRCNWQHEFIKKKQKERIAWKSKMYNLNTPIYKKSLQDQADHLMDSAAEEFSQWVNSLSDNRETDISKDILLSLFSLDRAAQLVRDASEKKVDPTISIKENVKVARNSKSSKKTKKIKPKEQTNLKLNTVAFGRTLPLNMRPCQQQNDDEEINQQIFPTELLNHEVLYRGITHLKPIRDLIQYYKENPSLEKPKYLIEIGCFDMKQKKTEIKNEIPLYELLNLQFE